MFLRRMGDKDRRVEFIQEYTLKSMRLKADKWNKIIIFDEQRQYLQVGEAHMSLCSGQCPTGRVFQYRVGSGRVTEKIPGSGSGSGRVGVLKI